MNPAYQQIPNDLKADPGEWNKAVLQAKDDSLASVITDTSATQEADTTHMQKNDQKSNPEQKNHDYKENTSDTLYAQNNSAIFENEVRIVDNTGNDIAKIVKDVKTDSYVCKVFAKDYKAQQNKAIQASVQKDPIDTPRADSRVTLDAIIWIGATYLTLKSLDFFTKDPWQIDE